MNIQGEKNVYIQNSIRKRKQEVDCLCLTSFASVDIQETNILIL